MCATSSRIKGSEALQTFRNASAPVAQPEPEHQGIGSPSNIPSHGDLLDSRKARSIKGSEALQTFRGAQRKAFEHAPQRIKGSEALQTFRVPTNERWRSRLRRIKGSEALQTFRGCAPTPRACWLPWHQGIGSPSNIPRRGGPGDAPRGRPRIKGSEALQTFRAVVNSWHGSLLLLAARDRKPFKHSEVLHRRTTSC